MHISTSAEDGTRKSLDTEPFGLENVEEQNGAEEYERHRALEALREVNIPLGGRLG